MAGDYVQHGPVNPTVTGDDVAPAGIEGFAAKVGQRPSRLGDEKRATRDVPRVQVAFMRPAAT
jgi:hypothetical protein